jgi:hypothetical protein
MKGRMTGWKTSSPRRLRILLLCSGVSEAPQPARRLVCLAAATAVALQLTSFRGSGLQTERQLFGKGWSKILLLPFAQLTGGSSCGMMRAWKKLFTRAVRAK